MTGMAVGPKFATWTAPEHSLRIEYAGAVLDEIRMIAVEGYHRVPHGGVETGGILFGTHQKNVVRIKAWRPIGCEYAKGPSFLLSEKDEAALSETLKSRRDDAELARMEPVGWYRAHTRSEILLSEADLAFFKRFFPQPWHVGLIVRPGSFAPTRAGFFFREQDGSIHSESSYREFTLMPLAAPQAAQPEASPPIPESPVVPEPAAAPEARIATIAEAARLEQPAEPAPPFVAPAVESRPRPGGRSKLYAWGLLLLVIAVLGFWLLKPSHQGLTLSAADNKGQLRIAWDRAARPIEHAIAGSIEIEDHGVRTQVNLTPAELRSGNIFYARQSGDVSVRLTVYVPEGPLVTETTRFLRPGESVPATSPRVEAAKKPEPSPKVETAQVPAAVPALQASPAVTLPTPVSPEPVRRAIPFRAPSGTPRRTSTESPTLALPPIENATAGAPASLPSVLGQAPAPIAAPVAAPPKPTAATTAASGRIIWTGKLAKNGRLVLERNHASSGSLSGLLPAVPARVSAYPGELTASGITLFTADPRYSQPLTEKAGAENGWNATTYTWDPKRAAGIKVVEQPGPQNGYRLVLESDAPKVSMVVLEWHATQ
jgi:proteasome lid subunit RPN8/RPN11